MLARTPSAERREAPPSQPEPDLPTRSVPDVADLVRQIDTRGYATVEGYVDPFEIAVAQDFVRDTVEANGGNYVMYTGPRELGGTFLADLGEDPDFIDLCRAVYAAGTGRTPPGTGFYQILRCLAGRQMSAHSLIFHYDSYVLTALIPILIPETGARGDLIVWPNTRPVRRTYFGNLVDKIRIDNPMAQRRFARMHAGPDSPFARIGMVPGNLYLFWGYRSIHTNEACDPGSIRSTALFHYADPHADSALKRRLRGR